MTNTAIYEMMINTYNRYAYTDKYIIGFPYKGVVYFGFINAEQFDRFLKLDIASRGQGYTIRFAPRNEQKLALLTLAKMEPLMSEKYLEECVAESKYNRGELFEKFITERFGQEWVKDNVPFNVAGDIEINGIPYQIKYAKAMLTTEKTLEKVAKSA